MDKANKALTNRNIDKAIKFYKLSAREGNDEANFELGKIYYKRIYNKKDLNLSFKYFKKAADYEHIKAKYNLAMIYSQKRFKKHSYKKAYNIFYALAQQGSPNAQYMVGIYCMEGLGVEKDYEKALRWFEESYFKNHYKKASCGIASIYANGLGVIQNLGRARRFSEHFIDTFPLCHDIFIDFKLYKEKYKEDKGFKFGFYR